MFFTKKSTKEMVQGESEAPTQIQKKRRGPKKEKQVREKTENRFCGRLSFLRTKTFWGVISVVLGIAIASIGIPMLQAAVTETVQIVCFAQDVSAGTLLTPDLLTTVEKSAYHLPNGAIYDLQAAVGQYVRTDALAEDIVTAARLSIDYPGPDPQLARLPEDMVAIAISLPDLAQSVSGKLRAGDVIRLFAVEDSSSFTAVALPELQFVEVLAATYTNGADVKDRQSGVPEESESDTLSTVTLLANDQQAACLTGLEHNATLHAALVIRGDDAAKAAALKLQSDYFNEPQEDAPADTEPTGENLSQTTPADQNT